MKKILSICVLLLALGINSVFAYHQVDVPLVFYPCTIVSALAIVYAINLPLEHNSRFPKQKKANKVLYVQLEGKRKFTAQRPVSAMVDKAGKVSV